MPDTYQNILSQYIEKLKKHLPHKQTQTKDLLTSFSGQGSNLFGFHIIAFKIGVNIKQSKTKEQLLTTLISLVSSGYIDGNLIDQSFTFGQNELSEVHEQVDKDKGHQINIIESLIHIATKCLVDKDDIIYLALKFLISLITNPYCNVQHHELVKIIRTVVYVYAQSKSTLIDKMCKGVLLQIIITVFQGTDSIYIVNFTMQSMLNKVSDERICVLCGQKGKFECRFNKVLVCSYKCKKQYQEVIEIKQKNYDTTQNVLNQLLKQLYPKQQLQHPRHQAIVLEAFYYICDNYVFSLNSKIINALLGHLLKFCLENETQVYQYSFKIFQRLVYFKHRELMNQINVFLNQIYINVLTNKNTTDLHKYTALDSLYIIFSRKHAPLEFYLNFDCSIKHEYLMENILDTLFTIFQQNDQYRTLITQIYQAILGGIEYTYNEKTVNIQPQETQQQQNENDETVMVNQLELQRQLKQEIQKGSEIFKKNPEKGIAFLIKANILAEDPQQIARFLLENKSITKSSVGMYLGGHHPMNIKVLSEYTDLLKFYNLTVEQALRQYLDLFTLPPESQQIDRIVQKFADRYYEDNLQNPNLLFKSSSSIYTFTYLLVMLQTDLHNPKVLDKMKLTDFIKLARQINDGDDLPSDYLTVTYQSVQKTPLAVRESSNSIQQLTQKDQYQKEIEELLKKVKDLIRRQPDTNYIQIDSESVYLSRALAESKSGKFLEIFLTVYETAQNGDAIIKSILQLIKVCSKLSIGIEQLTQSIIKAALNGLQRRNSNMLIIGFLTTIPTIGNSLHDAGWKIVLELLSYLDELRQIDQDYTEKVFVCSKDLDNQSIEEFINALCLVSKQEIYQKQRIYALQKLVEVSDYNMDRVKLIWNRLWAIVSSHINEVAVKEKKITMFAVDSLKQLNIKFLQKEELYNIQFQREVLKPFELIFNTSESDVKEFILSCVKQIVQHHKKNIKSGWKVIFSLINQGLKEENERISKLAFELLSIIEIEEILMVDLIQTLQLLGRKDNETMALGSIKFVQQCLKFMQNSSSQTLWVPLLGILANLAGDRRSQVQTQAVETLFQILETFGHQFNEEYWKMIFSSVLRPIFDEIQFTLSTNPELNQSWFKDSCQKVLQNITNLLKNHFSKLKGQLTDFLRLFQNCIQNQNEKLASLSIQAFKTMIQDQGSQFNNNDWDEVVLFITIMLKQTIPTQLYNINVQQTQSNDTTPTKKFSRQKSYKTVINSIINECYSQCASQLLLIQTSKDIIEVYYKEWNLQQLEQLEQVFFDSYQFAKQFNSQVEQRYSIWRSGFMIDMNVLPGLLRQEREAFSCMLTIKQYKLKLIQQSEELSEIYESSLQSYLCLLIDSINNFNNRHSQFIEQQEVSDDIIVKLKQQECEREIQNMRTLLDLSIMPKLLSLTDEELRPTINELHDILLTSLSYVSEYSIFQMTCADCKKCNRCLQKNNNLFQQIKKCLQRLFLLK